MDWWNVSVFGIIPVLSIIAMFCFKRKFLWAAPLISTALSIVVSAAAMPSIFRDYEHRAMFFGIAVPMHIAVVIVLTVIAYIVASALTRGRKQQLEKYARGSGANDVKEEDHP